jgi:malonyl-CoA/methylmalonyl-CoA synthetase
VTTTERTPGNPLAHLLLGAADQTPEAIAVRSLDQAGSPALSYREIAEQSAAMAQVLSAHGVAPGDRVAVVAQKSATFLVLHVACARAGAVFVPLNPDYTDTELSALLSDADPQLLVLDPLRTELTGSRRWLTLDEDDDGTLRETVQRVSDDGTAKFVDVPRSGDDPATMLYTSGTTGRPKAAVLSHANVVANARTLVAAWGFTERDALLHVLPLFHTHGLFVAAHCALASGAQILLRSRFDARVTTADLAMATVFMGVPTHYTRLLAEPRFGADSTAHVRLFTSGSAPMLVETHEAVRDRTGHTVLERYGMTETGMLTSNPLLGERRIGTVGPALPGVQVRIADGSDRPASFGEVGAVQVRGANVFSGYWQRPELQATEFTDDGWFRTGDLGRLDRGGYLELVGRAKDLIITGGMNVYPKEVELALDALDSVIESAVVGIPDPDFGEVVAAAVVPAPDCQLDPQEVRRAARTTLAPYKVPKRVIVLDSLPRNTMGKVEKTRLRREFT